MLSIYTYFFRQKQKKHLMLEKNWLSLALHKLHYPKILRRTHSNQNWRQHYYLQSPEPSGIEMGYGRTDYHRCQSMSTIGKRVQK